MVSTLFEASTFSTDQESDGRFGDWPKNLAKFVWLPKPVEPARLERRVNHRLGVNIAQQIKVAFGRFVVAGKCEENLIHRFAELYSFRKYGLRLQGVRLSMFVEGNGLIPQDKLCLIGPDQEVGVAVEKIHGSASSRIQSINEIEAQGIPEQARHLPAEENGGVR